MIVFAPWYIVSKTKAISSSLDREVHRILSFPVKSCKAPMYSFKHEQLEHSQGNLLLMLVQSYVPRFNWGDEGDWKDDSQRGHGSVVMLLEEIVTQLFFCSAAKQTALFLTFFKKSISTCVK